MSSRTIGWIWLGLVAATLCVGVADGVMAAGTEDPTAGLRERFRESEDNGVLILNSVLGILFLVVIGWSAVTMSLKWQFMLLLVGLGAALNGWAAFRYFFGGTV